jgi:hypothetical protein
MYSEFVSEAIESLLQSILEKKKLIHSEACAD